MLWVTGCLLFMACVVHTSRRFHRPAQMTPENDKREPLS